MGFWNELMKVYDTPSQWAGEGIYRLAHGLTGSDKLAAAGARMGSVSTRALGGDPVPFRENQQGSDFGMSDTAWRKGRQAGDWTGSAVGSLFTGGALGSALAGGGGSGTAASVPATAGEGGATITGSSGLSGLDLEAAAGTGQGAWVEPAGSGGSGLGSLLQKLGAMQGQGGSSSSSQGGQSNIPPPPPPMQIPQLPTFAAMPEMKPLLYNSIISDLLSRNRGY